MTESVKVDFHCPSCNAGYAVVTVSKEPGRTYRPVRCRVCRGPMPATNNGDIFKYFLVRRPPPPPPPAMHGD
jgi:hypothetical protein